MEPNLVDDPYSQNRQSLVHGVRYNLNNSESSISMSSSSFLADSRSSFSPIRSSETVIANEEPIVVVRRDDHQEEMPKSCWSKAKFFIWHSARDTKRNKCHFGLAFCSIFTVVFSILVINSVIA